MANDVLNHPVGWRYGYYELHTKLLEWARKNDQHLKSATIEDSVAIELKRLHSQWLEYLIMDYQTWSHVQETEDATKSLPTVSLVIFVELTRSHYLIVRDSLRQDFEESQSIFGVFGENQYAYTLSKTTHFTPHQNLDWNKPVLKYTMQEVVYALLMVTEQINRLPFAAVQETQAVLEALYTRHAMFVCEKQAAEVLDVVYFVSNGQPNRDYLMFASVYFHAVQRRLFYTKLIPHRTLVMREDVVARCEAWFEKEVVHTLSGETFDALYAAACEESYVFPGDKEWFTYRHPDRPNHQLSSVLECFRGDIVRKFASEYRLSKETIFSQRNQHTHTGYCAKIFGLHAIENYVKNHISSDLEWKEAVTITNEMIEGNDTRLMREMETPYFLQMFSHFYVYHVSHIYICDNFCESFAIWLSLIDRKDKKTVRWHALIDKLLYNKEEQHTNVIYTGNF
jgi:hypothetical protein